MLLFVERTTKLLIQQIGTHFRTQKSVISFNQNADKEKYKLKGKMQQK